MRGGGVVGGRVMRGGGVVGGGRVMRTGSVVVGGGRVVTALAPTAGNEVTKKKNTAIKAAKTFKTYGRSKKLH